MPNKRPLCQHHRCADHTYEEECTPKCPPIRYTGSTTPKGGVDPDTFVHPDTPFHGSKWKAKHETGNR